MANPKVNPIDKRIPETKLKELKKIITNNTANVASDIVDIEVNSNVLSSNADVSWADLKAFVNAIIGANN